MAANDFSVLKALVAVGVFWVLVKWLGIAAIVSFATSSPLLVVMIVVIFMWILMK